MVPDARRTLPPGVTVAPGLDVDRLWRDFEIFEALHHSRAIATPASSDDLDAVIDLLDPQPGTSLLDIATGSGELARLVIARTSGAAVGVDLSPWMIRNAARRTEAGMPIRWILGDASRLMSRRHELGLAETYDYVTCLGASWIWHGLEGTIAALAQWLAPGGRMVIGDMHVRDDVDSATVPAGLRREAEANPEDLFGRQGLTLIGSVLTDDATWDAYLAQTGDDARRWQEQFPGPTADRYVAEQQDWIADHDRDRQWRAWTMWVASLT